MRQRLSAKAFVTALTGFATVATLGGLGAASALTTDLTLTVDGQTTALRVWGGTVGQVLDGRDIVIDDRDFVYPSLDTTVQDGLQIEVAHARPLTATIDGRTMTLTTTANTIDGALAALGVDAAAADLSLPPQTQITPDGAAITVTTSKMISLRADGATLYTLTTSNTVADLLAERGIALGGSDRVTPALTTVLTDDMSVVVQRVQVVRQTATIDLPFDTTQVKTSTLPKGTTQVKTPGVTGQADQVWDVTLVDGTEESRDLVSQTTTKDPVNEVVEVGTGSTRTSSAGSATTPPASGSPQEIARNMLAEFGFGDDQFTCLVNLWNRESGWRVNAQNPSGAYGIPQALPGSKMASVGADWRTNPATQIRWGLGYIQSRYGTPCGAWSAFQSKGWY